ncbi:hypothetical protein EVAR_13481_1 [Eumeta japonica]|uniref:Uncharacterized protein n=1 Tax=Eumeta variegata TaxID=151549 RepID=A0A4C1UXZ3_EUMVA|nr:hypothetical protein EVAR_13481_1 [Eumeta japonica]
MLIKPHHDKSLSVSVRVRLRLRFRNKSRSGHLIIRCACFIVKATFATGARLYDNERAQFREACVRYTINRGLDNVPPSYEGLGGIARPVLRLDPQDWMENNPGGCVESVT